MILNINQDKEYEVIKNTGPTGEITYKAKSKDKGKEIPLYIIELNDAGEAVFMKISSSAKRSNLYNKNLAGDKGDSKGVRTLRRVKVFLITHHGKII